ncbi:MAG: hypothetical protein LC650_05075 [Actinobacteria bacterium]|nr:hypothetical protein [Actinomycetota bacterium]
MEDRYLQQLREITKDTESDGVPDRVKKYTHDINGARLPCEFIQLNEQVVYHLNKIPKHINAGNDYFALCFGYPGSGKTHSLIRACLYLNASFSLDDISFTIPQLEEWIREAEPGSVGLFDEADAMANGYYDSVLRSLINNSKRIRTKRLVLFFCTPTMKDMHHFFAFRAKMVLYSFVPKKTAPDNRGWLHMWHDQDLISDLFARMKKAYSENSRVYDSSFSTLRNKYIGREVPSDWPIDEAAYEAKKELGRRELEEREGLTPTQAVHKFRSEVIRNLDRWVSEKQLDVTQKDLAWIVKLSRRRYGEILEEAQS